MNNSFEEIAAVLRGVKRAVILPHLNADGDAVGSCKAMKAMIEMMGGQADIYSEERIEERLSFISDGIEVFTGNEDKAYDTCIALDCGDEQRLGKRAVFAQRADAIVNIDHHRTNTYFGNINYVDPNAAATAQILAALVSYMGIKPDKVMAEYLYTAICSDTGCFAYSNTSSATMRIAADLLETGIDHAECARLLFDSVPLETELLKAELTKSIRSYYGGRLRIVSAVPAIAEKYGLDMDDVSDLVNIPRRITGTEIAVSIKYDGVKIRASLRSNGDADVAAVALKLGGGGHTRAAGCTVDAGSIEDAEAMIVKECGEALS